MSKCTGPGGGSGAHAVLYPDTCFFALQDTNANKNQRNVINSSESEFRYAKICLVEITGEGWNPLRFEISQEVLECLQPAKASASRPAKDRALQEFWHIGTAVIKYFRFA